MNLSATTLSLLGLVALLGAATAAAAGAVYAGAQEADVDYLLPPESDSDLTESESGRLEKRYYISYSCRRCLHQPSDFSACIQCYSRPGSPTPYFGVKKRAFDDLYSFLPKDYDSLMSKRSHFSASSFMACKCCLSVGRSSCCSHCGFRQQDKRGYMTSFVGLDRMSSCGCCASAMFDFSCCIRCRSRK